MATVSDLSPRNFENLTYDLCASGGLRSLVWRTPGADGGRDIEGHQDVTDWTGAFVTSKWYIECKRYTASISWPVIWTKIAHADAHGADFLLLATNSNPSPSCETEIANWNLSGKRVKIRVWRGYDFGRLLSHNPKIAQKYGLLSNRSIPFSEDLAFLIARIAQANESGASFSANIDAGLTTASALAELLVMRSSHVKDESRFLRSPKMQSEPGWEWLDLSQVVFPIPDEVGLRAVLSFLHYTFRPNAVQLTMNGATFSILMLGSRFNINATTRDSLVQLLVWTEFEFSDEPSAKAVSIRWKGDQ